MRATLSNISIQPGNNPENQTIRLEFNNGRFHQAEITGPYVEDVEMALIMLLDGLRKDHHLIETKK